MENYLVFSASKMNWGLIHKDTGAWLRTNWMVSQNKNVISETEYDSYHDCLSNKTVPRRIVRREYQMNEFDFALLRSSIQDPFIRCAAGSGCDGIGWEMKSFSADRTVIHSVSGYIHGDKTLEYISELLEKSVPVDSQCTTVFLQDHATNPHNAKTKHTLQGLLERYFR